MKIHIVQKGDTLWKIAKKYGVDFEQLKKMNTQLSNPDMIMPGMKIKVPTSGGTVKKETLMGTQQKEAQINFGTKKEMPIVQHPYAKEQPKEMPVEEIVPQVAGVQDIAPEEEITPQVAGVQDIAPVEELPIPEIPKPPQPEVKPQPKPELKPQQLPKVQPKPQSKPKPKVQPKAQPKPLPKQQPKVQPIAQEKPKPKQQPKAVKPLKQTETPKPVIPKAQFQEQFIQNMEEMKQDVQPQLPPKAMNVLPQLMPVLPVENVGGAELNKKETIKGGVQEPMFQPNFFPYMYNMPQTGAVSPFSGGQMPFSGLPGVPMDYQDQYPQQPNFPPQVMGMEDDGQYPLMPESGNMPQMPLMPESGNMPQMPLMPESGNFPQMPMVEPTMMQPCPPMYPISPVLPGPGPVPGYCPPMHMPMHHHMPMYPISPVMPGPGPVPSFQQPMEDYQMPQVAGQSLMPTEGNMPHQGNFPHMMTEPTFAGMNDCGCGTPMHGHAFPGQFPMGGYGFPQGMMPYGYPQGMMGVRHDWQSPNFDIDEGDGERPHEEFSNEVTAYPPYYGQQGSFAPQAGSMPYFNPYQPMGTWYPAFYTQRQQNDENNNE